MPRIYPTVVRRPMTEEERAIALAICPLRVRYTDPTHKRKARQLADVAEFGPAVITNRQADSLIQLAIRYRRQLPADVLTIAERLAPRAKRGAA